MKKLLFVCMGLGIGGTEKTLVEAINSVDYERFSVDVYARKNRDAYVPLIDNRANIIINRNMPSFETKPVAELCDILSNICLRINRKGLSNSFIKRRQRYILRKRQEYEARFFKKKVYDYAIAYDMAQECVSFVKNHILAKKKIAFFHASQMNKKKKQLYMAFDRIVAVNSEVQNNLICEYPDLSSKTIAIENYINPEIPQLENNNCQSNDLVLCTCGRYAKEKGFDMAIETAYCIKQKGIQFIWYFVGDGSERANLESLIAKYELSNEIILTGFQQDPYSFINNCDIYVQPSFEEAHATTMIEAMLLYKPIVSTNTCSGRYFEQEYGTCIVSPINAKELANTIVELYHNKKQMDCLINNAKSVIWEDRRHAYKSKINTMFEHIE